jgi:chaperonin GroES
MAQGALPTTVVIDPDSDGQGQADRPTLEEAQERIDSEPGFATTADKLTRLSTLEGDLSGFLTAEGLRELGSKVVDDYEQDKKDRKEWADVAEEALKACAQEEVDKAKDYPWPGASNMQFPLLTSAALQFNARMYPAVVKGDEAVLCKVVGQDNGQPKMGPNPKSGAIQPIPDLRPNPETGQLEPQLGPDGQMLPLWAVPPGAKSKRARRVSEYMNHVVFYRMESWEDDTDQLLMQIPAVGCAFRKVFWDADLGCQAVTVPALRLLVPKGTRSLRQAFRITEEIPDVYPHEMLTRSLDETYRDYSDDITLGEDEADKGRLLLEQHRLIDLDGDGLGEPYIVTVDHSTSTVLRVEANYSQDDIRYVKDRRPNAEAGAQRVAQITRRQFYVKYGMFPHPKGEFYDIGLGHLLKRLGAVIDTSLNQLLDAGHAQTAGGGFIGSGVRLQSRGNRGVIRIAPGEYKTVDVPGDNLRANIVEKTLPNVSPVTFQVLDLIMGAARDIAGAKDVITGEASNNGQVGTTLALIEQGLQVFNAAAKRCFRALKNEYELMYENIARYGGEEEAAYYARTLDDLEADFEADFNGSDLDIRPVSDPATVTRMQKMARAQFILGLAPGLAQVGGDPREAYKRALEAVDAEDIDKLLPPPKPAPPDPFDQAMKEATVAGARAKAMKDEGQAKKAEADALNSVLEAARKKYENQRDAQLDGMALGHADETNRLRLEGLNEANRRVGITPFE